MKRKPTSPGEILREESPVPESQRWTLEEPHRSRIERGLTWASSTAPAESDIDALADRPAKPVSRPRTHQ